MNGQYTCAYAETMLFDIGVWGSAFWVLGSNGVDWV